MIRWSVALAGVLLLLSSLSFAVTGEGAPTFSPAGLYDQANAYVRAGKPGLAVLHYERARLLAPGDPDIGANLSAVRATLRIADPPANRALLFLAVLTPTVAAIIGLVGLLLIAAGIAYFAGSRPRRRLRAASISVGAVCIAITVGHGVLLWPTLHEAIVVIAEAPALESPVPMAEPLFVLHEAQDVVVTAEHDHFLLVHAPDGKSGWVADTSVIRVLPRN